MKEGLKYLNKLELDEELDAMFEVSLILFKKFRGKLCKECGIIQGSKHKGWNEYYCKHTEDLVNEILKSHQIKAMQKFDKFVKGGEEE